MRYRVGPTSVDVAEAVVAEINSVGSNVAEVDWPDELSHRNSLVWVTLTTAPAQILLLCKAAVAIARMTSKGIIISRDDSGRIVADELAKLPRGTVIVDVDEVLQVHLPSQGSVVEVAEQLASGLRDRL